MRPGAAPTAARERSTRDLFCGCLATQQACEQRIHAAPSGMRPEAATSLHQTPHHPYPTLSTPPHQRARRPDPVARADTERAPQTRHCRRRNTSERTSPDLHRHARRRHTSERATQPVNPTLSTPQHQTSERAAPNQPCTYPHSPRNNPNNAPYSLLRTPREPHPTLPRAPSPTPTCAHDWLELTPGRCSPLAVASNPFPSPVVECERHHGRRHSDPWSATRNPTSASLYPKPTEPTHNERRRRDYTSAASNPRDAAATIQALRRTQDTPPRVHSRRAASMPQETPPRRRSRWHAACSRAGRRASRLRMVANRV